MHRARMHPDRNLVMARRNDPGNCSLLMIVVDACRSRRTDDITDVRSRFRQPATPVTCVRDAPQKITDSDGHRLFYGFHSLVEQRNKTAQCRVWHNSFRTEFPVYGETDLRTGFVLDRQEAFQLSGSVLSA